MLIMLLEWRRIGILIEKMFYNAACDLSVFLKANFYMWDIGIWEQINGNKGTCSHYSFFCKNHRFL